MHRRDELYSSNMYDALLPHFLKDLSFSLTPFKSGQRTTPLQVLREACRDTCTFRLCNDFKRNRFSICFLLIYSTSRSPERSFFILFGSPAMPIKTFSITKGERLDIDLSSCEWMTRKRGEAVDIVG